MAVHVSWYDDAHTILYYRFDKVWKLDEMFAALSTGQQMVAAEDHIVDSIFDLTNSSTVPQRMLSSIRSVERATPKNLRFTVAVGMSAFLTVMADMVGKAAPLLMKNFRTASTLDEALALLNRLRSPGV
jgi:hypothetical protein